MEEHLDHVNEEYDDLDRGDKLNYHRQEFKTKISLRRNSMDIV